MRTAKQKNRVAITSYYTDDKGDQRASFSIFPLKDRDLEYLIENDTPRTMNLQFYSRNPLEVKEGEYTKRDVAHLRELAIANGATHLIVLEPYNESLRGHKKITDEELDVNDQNMSERVRIGIIFEGSRNGYHYPLNYTQEHVFSNILTERFYRVVMSYQPQRPFDPDPKEAFVKSFMKTGRFYTGILDNNPVFDYLYVANKDGTIELYDRDGDMTVLNPTRTASSVRVASRYLSR
jgi:hypothetical protein